MKYVKPNAEVIRIENEDIVTASGGCTSTSNGNCMINTDGANCSHQGIIGEPNSYEAMGCTGNSGSMPDCSNHYRGVTCDKEASGYMTCASGWAGTTSGLVCTVILATSGNNPNCDRFKGANNL